MSETRTRIRLRSGGSTRIPDAPRPELPDQVVMPLLDRIVRQSLDEDYRVVAERKAARARSRRRERNRQRGRQRGLQRAPKPPPPRVRPRRVAAAVMAVFGVLVAIAAVQTTRNAPEANASRASLVDQIQARRATIARLQGRLDRLQTSITGQRDALAQAAEDEQVLVARAERLGVRSGFVAVHGPGVRIHLDDTPDGDVTQVVRASDLAMLVDGLWNAGAEAIAVNNLRLTALTAFANVGPAVHIGKVPLDAPYTIEAIGDQDTLAADLLDTTFGQRFYSLKDSLGFPYDIRSVDEMRLPAGQDLSLRTVHLPDDSGNRPQTDGGVNVP
jgi:uncharacterized protein YlxW (UPF0749 family)